MENKSYIVTGYHLTSVFMRVKATNEEEAVQKAKEGDYEVLDTEPAGNIYKPKWTAEEE